MEKKRTSIYGIKGKLVSACCMLLVAVIMVVSSTYAWFTLSTAPEVKGITTSIGANGALEIWLNKTNDQANGTPGNLVDLSTGYGLEQINLYPSKLNLTDAGKLNTLNFVYIPQYAANGRVTEIVGNRTEAGNYNGTAFVAGSATGVRAVGVASGLTERQLAYRNAKYAAITNANTAKDKAAISLSTNGSALGKIVIKQGTIEGARYSKDELLPLGTIIDDLLVADTGVLAYIESAYEQMIVAFAASKLLDDMAGDNVVMADTIYTYVKSNVGTGDLALDKIVENSAIKVTYEGTPYSFDLTNNPILTAIGDFLTTKAAVTAADTAFDNLMDGTAPENGFVWNDVSNVLNFLIDSSKVTINGTSVSQIKENPMSLLGGSINIQLNDGAGVYEAIADQCGDYSAVVTLKNVEAAGMTIPSVTVNMVTITNTKPVSYLTLAQEGVTAAGQPAGTTTNAMPMTEFYGYVIDLVFRTNAANSNLLLQTEAADRIYADNDNTDTQGGGSYMTFASTSSEFTTAQVQSLMQHIRIVFFDTTNGTILGTAMLDVEHSSVGADGVTAKMYLYEEETYYSYTPAGGEEIKYTVEATTTTGEGEGATATTTYKYYAYGTETEVTEQVTAIFADATSKIPSQIVKKTVYNALTGGKTSENAPVITSLAQNTEVKVSALVYLDGETIENKDVAATGTSSIKGKMNLQFSSSAELVPMEYGDLHTPADTPTTTTGTATENTNP